MSGNLEWAIRQQVGSPMRKMVLVAAALARSESGRASVADIASIAEVPEAVVRLALKRLHRDNFIEITRADMTRWTGPARRTPRLTVIDGGAE